MIKVIIADDEEKVCGLIKNLIDWAKFNMEVIGIAHDGVETLAKIKELEPDIVITDIRMPGYDGIELIQRGKEYNPDLEFIIVSGYRHFDYAQQAIRFGVMDYLLKPLKKEELEATLEKMSQKYLPMQEYSHPSKKDRIKQESDQKQFERQGQQQRLRHAFFQDWVMQKSWPASESREQKYLSWKQIQQQYHFAFTQGYFQFVLIHWDIIDPIDARNVSFLNQKIQQISVAHLKEFLLEGEMFWENSHGCYLLNYSVLNEKNVQEGLKQILDEARVLRQIFPALHVTIGLGSPGLEISHLPLSFREAEVCIDLRFWQGQNRIISFEDLHFSPWEVDQSFTLASVVTKEELKGLDQITEILDEKLLTQWLEDFCPKMESLPKGKAQFLSTLSVNLLLYFITKLELNGFVFQDKDAFLDNYIMKINYSGTFAVLVSIFKQNFETVLAGAILYGQQKNSKPIRQAKQFMQEKFSQNLTLGEISQIAGFNPSYFSSLFKQETGQTITEYLIEIRMEKAKEFLRDTNWPIAQICQMVGYLDLKHFSKSFAKANGIKPAAYRKLYS